MEVEEEDRPTMWGPWFQTCSLQTVRKSTSVEPLSLWFCYGNPSEWICHSLTSSCLDFQWLACTHLFFSHSPPIYYFCFLFLTPLIRPHIHCLINITEGARNQVLTWWSKIFQRLFATWRPTSQPSSYQRTLLAFPTSPCTRVSLSQTTDLVLDTHQL